MCAMKYVLSAPKAQIFRWLKKKRNVTSKVTSIPRDEIASPTEPPLQSDFLSKVEKDM